MRIFETANYQFIPNRRFGYILSGILLALSLFSLVTRGLEVGIDFRGGMEFVIDADQPLDPVQLRSQLTPYVGMEPEAKTYDGVYTLVRVASEDEINVVEESVVRGVNETFPGSNARIVRTDIVGPRFADDLRRGAIFSILGSLLVIFVYILIRFEWRYGLGAVAALFHDVTITLGIFSLLHGIVPFSLQMDQAIIAAFLTIVGYSLNDTVVVFDRVREYKNMFKTDNFSDVVNRSINATLSRTIVTSGTTLLVVLTLFIFGGEVLRGFAFALMLGVMIGTYSSIFVASPVVVELASKDARRA
jgi:preprotein translocase subunit SecF